MTTSIVVAYPFTHANLAEQVDALRGHSFGTPALYREGTKAIGTCRSLRVQIEERRKLLKQDSLEYGRKVDSVAKELTAIIEAVEQPLKDAKRLVDDAKEQAKRDAAEAERRRVEEEIRAKREAEEQALREQRKAEEERLAEERRQLAAERAQMAAERAELQRQQLAQQEALAKLQARDREALQKVEAEERAEAARVRAEEQRINALEAEKVRQRRLAALQPDQDKLAGLARAIRDLAPAFAEVEFESESACLAAETAMEALVVVALGLEQWKEKQR